MIFQNHGTHEDIFFLKKKITDNGFSDATILTMLTILQTVFIIILKYNVFTQLKTCTENRPRFRAKSGLQFSWPERNLRYSEGSFKRRFVPINLRSSLRGICAPRYDDKLPILYYCELFCYIIVHSMFPPKYWSKARCETKDLLNHRWTWKQENMLFVQICITSVSWGGHFVRVK